MKNTLLEVLIPTYNRPSFAVKAIDSVLNTGDSRVSVLCHSNGFEQILFDKSTKADRLNYAYFTSNRGALANFRELISLSTSKYILFLSDEDVLNKTHCQYFLDFLEKTDASFIVCDIDEIDGSHYFSTRSLWKSIVSYSDLMTILPVHPTYVSGFCYKRELISDELLDRCFTDEAANVYPHVLLRNAISKIGEIWVFQKPVILKGNEAGTGGDSHSHASSLSQPGSSNGTRSLNPSVYGAIARVRQYFFFYYFLNLDLKSLGFLRRNFSKLCVTTSWLKMISEASKFTDTSIKNINFLQLRHDPRLCADPYVVLFVQLIKRSDPIRAILIRVLWSMVAVKKLAYLVYCFGPFRTWSFIRRR